MPSELVPVRRALLSVSDKTDLVPFARGLIELGVGIVSTGGTAAALAQAGIEVIAVDQVTGFPEMMDGRVKTLHPAIHGALLGRRDLEHHRRAMEEHRITPIDLVCVNLYPFEQTIQNNGVTPEEAIEQIDIGGPAVIRSAAKNHQFVAVVTSPSQYDRVVNELRDHEGATSGALRRELAAAAFARTAEYDTAIGAWMSAARGTGRGPGGGFPEMLRLHYGKVRDLRYGENPHQRAAVYVDPASSGPSVVSARVLHGKPLSYNNLLDGAAALDLVLDLRDLPGAGAVAAIIKHTNACGAAVAATAADAFLRAHEGDPAAAYGGILALSQALDEPAAAAIAETGRFLEVIIAPDFDRPSRSVLSRRWSNVRLLATGPAPTRGGTAWTRRSIPGGLLVQTADLRPTNPDEWVHAAGPRPDHELLADAAFAWTVARHLKSNAIALAAGGRLLGAGPGQVDRIGACRIAIDKAGDGVGAQAAAGRRVVAASDAFFPFADGPALLIEAGVRAIVQPGGSKRDAETVDACDAAGVTLMLTGVRHFRH